KWIESEEDVQKRINVKKRKRDDAKHGTTKNKFICDCGQPAKRLSVKNGMEHNHGRAFYSCETRRCRYWIWADGTLPFSDESQARFNDYMDSRFDSWGDDW